MSDLPDSPAENGAAPLQVAHPPALRPGTSVQEYQVQRTLGSGGFGLTYLARDTHLDQPVALKEFFPAESARRLANGDVAPWTEDDHAQEAFRAAFARFHDEARTLAALRHPHVVRVLRFFEAHGTGYIVMEYEAGLPLRQWAPRQAPLTREALLRIVLPLLDGLEAAHAAGFLHRDVKPDNILVRPDGSPVLLDFGAAGRVNDAAPARSATVSPGFAAPEQYGSTQGEGPWTDVYAMGAVMYWLATGTKPPEATDRLAEDRMPPAARHGAGGAFGLPLLSVIDQALRPQVQQRLQSVAELRAAIAAAGGPPALSWANAVSLPHSMPAGVPRRDLLCSVLFMDLAGHSLRPVDEQVALKARLNGFIARALEGAGVNSRLALDTGDGVALCFLDDPQDALAAALRLADALDAAHRPAGLQVRCGLHIGPVRIVPDINRRLNILGDGINVARRVMDFAQPNQVLASRIFRDAIARRGDDRAGLFCYAGPHLDKHGRIHELHLLERGVAHPASGTVHISEAVAIWYAGPVLAAPAPEHLLRLEGAGRRGPAAFPARHRDAGTAVRRRARAPALARPLVSPPPPAPPRS